MITATQGFSWAFLKARCSGQHRPTCLRVGGNNGSWTWRWIILRFVQLRFSPQLMPYHQCRPREDDLHLHSWSSSQSRASSCLVQSQDLRTQRSCPIATSHANCWGQDPHCIRPPAGTPWPKAAVPCSSARRGGEPGWGQALVASILTLWFQHSQILSNSDFP